MTPLSCLARCGLSNGTTPGSAKSILTLELMGLVGTLQRRAKDTNRLEACTGGPSSARPRNSRRTRDNCPPKLSSYTVGIYRKKRSPNTRFCHGATSGFVGWVVVPFWKTQLQPVGLVPNWEITPHEIWGALRAPRDPVVQGDTRHARNRKSCTDLARFEEGRPRSV